MTIAKKTEEVLKDELEPEDIKTVIDMAEFLKSKEKQAIWKKIDESEKEEITEGEYHHIENIESNGELVDQKTLLNELGIEDYEV